MCSLPMAADKNKGGHKPTFCDNFFFGPKGPHGFFARKKDVAQGAWIFTILVSWFYTYKCHIKILLII